MDPAERLWLPSVRALTLGLCRGWGARGAADEGFIGGMQACCIARAAHAAAGQGPHQVAHIIGHDKCAGVCVCACACVREDVTHVMCAYIVRLWVQTSWS